MEISKKLILLVDDSPLIIKRLTELLQELSFASNILSSGDYEQSIKILASQIVDIVLLDIQLPGKNGIELLQFIKTNYPQIKVIMLSNEAGKYYRDLCKREGAAYFIDKSKEFEMIPQVLSSFC